MKKMTTTTTAAVVMMVRWWLLEHCRGWVNQNSNWIALHWKSTQFYCDIEANERDEEIEKPKAKYGNSQPLLRFCMECCTKWVGGRSSYQIYSYARIILQINWAHAIKWILKYIKMKHCLDFFHIFIFVIGSGYHGF